MPRADLTFRPRLLSAPAAAAYLGISASTLRGLPIPRRVHNARRLYDILDLDAYADALPYEGDLGDEVNTCRGKFGRRAS